MSKTSVIIKIPDTLTSKMFTNKDEIVGFECLICLEILNDPVQCKRGHVFCRECILAALKKCEECPSCRDSLTEATLSECLFAKQQITSRQIYCFTCVDGGKEPEKKSSSSGSSGGGAKKRAKIDACTWTGKLEVNRSFSNIPFSSHVHRTTYSFFVIFHLTWNRMLNDILTSVHTLECCANTHQSVI